ncbi:MAG: 4Fe-4S dicluster domain-containing protein [Candidatus Omnitrophota bacterium]
MTKVNINQERCKGCLLCLSACSKKSIIVEQKVNIRGVKTVKFKDGAECIGCAMCAVICPEACIEIIQL